MKNIIRMVVSLCMVALITSCGSGGGTQGPMGVQGAQGVPGPTGATGASGQSGKNGTNGTNGVNGITLHVVDASGTDIGYLVTEDPQQYKVYNVTIKKFVQIMKVSGKLDFNPFNALASSYRSIPLYYGNSDCDQSGVAGVYVSLYAGMASDDLIVDQYGNCFSVTSGPQSITVNSQSWYNGDQFECGVGTSTPEVEPTEQISCQIPTQYATPLSIKVQ